MLTIVIPTMQKDKEILDKLVLLLSKDNLVDEIIIIDNSKKGYSIGQKKVRTIVPRKNLYVNPSWNLGVEKAKNNIIGILNDDILISENFIEQVYNFINKTPDVGILGLDSKYIENFEKEDFSTLPNNTIFSFEKYNETFKTNFFGSAFFFKKENYYKIPNNIKVWCGDNFLLKKNLENKKQNYQIKNLEIKHLKSMTCKNPIFHKIKVDDICNYAKIDKIFETHGYYTKRPTFLQKIFSVRNEFDIKGNKRKLAYFLGFKVFLR